MASDELSKTRTRSWSDERAIVVMMLVGALLLGFACAVAVFSG